MAYVSALPESIDQLCKLVDRGVVHRRRVPLHESGASRWRPVAQTTLSRLAASPLFCSGASDA